MDDNDDKQNNKNNKINNNNVDDDDDVRTRLVLVSPHMLSSLTSVNQRTCTPVAYFTVVGSTTQ